MNGIQALAIQKIKSDSKRNEIAVGDHDVDFVIHVKGYVRVGEDVDYTPTGELSPLGIMAIAMRYCGVTREALAKAIIEAANDAKREGVTFREKVTAEKEWADDTLARVKAQLSYELDKKTRKGAVTGKVSAELIDLPNLVELQLT